MPSAVTILLWEDDSGATEFVIFDACTAQTHEGTVEITEHPVEEGSDVADHARPAPERLSLEGFVSNTPMWSNPGVHEFGSFRKVDLEIPDQPDLNLSVGTAIVSAVGSLFGSGAPDSIQALAFDEFRNRAREVYEKLEDARVKTRRIRVETSLREYEDMTIERLAEPRTPDDGSGILFQLDLKRIRVVRSETVSAPEPAEARGAVTVSKGSKAAKDDANPEKKREKLKSLAAQGFDGAAEALGL
jgi:hypothetical protein